ncbi:amidohydrolase family protein [Jiangella mangrovi]|uniref:Cytosine/adenosine deaminase-related metal-dependent hydrolase n=1 Tax=Jiangella mangrovi TaxID=1524084 RepID=A0A7W9GVC2_9ACTN|nr:amidohydrolase family protein [Jiangella mangrovi]MBB5790479.1 cytosine/adenosine deaminase-related metal-dependent hydrolase [Jiangella mangrovi]
MSTRLLLSNGHVISMDPDIGDVAGADVLIEDGAIVAVRPGLSAEVTDAEVVDATGRIVIPGFVDTHRHTWETAIRTSAPNATLDDYFVEILDTFAPLYGPDDVYASNLAGSLECLNAGITTLVDWSHINNTPEHPDAAINGLREAGLRAQYAYGSANTSLAKYWFNSAEVIPGDDVRRIRSTYFAGDDGLLTMGLATRGPGFCQDDVVTAEWALAREVGIPLTVHVAMGRLAGRFAMVEQLDRLGLLGPDTTYVHCCYFSDHEWRRVADTGGTISIAAQVELQMGHGWPPVAKSYQFGLAPSLSIDVVTTVPGDMFTQMRAAFGGERARINATSWQADTLNPDTTPTARHMLEMATINGAQVAGLADRTGSLTPGKRGDVVLIDATALNVAPVMDPVAAVVLAADVSNVETVIVDGVIRKQGGKLLADVDRARGLVEAARDRLVAAAEKNKAAAG